MRFIAIFLFFLPFRIWCNPFPVQIVNGFLVSKATIEGKEVWVIFDTGAPGLVLNDRYYTADKGPKISCTGINGHFHCSSHKVETWSWLDIPHKKTDALLTDLSFLENTLHHEVHALIGLSCLEHYYVTIDFDRAQITLADKIKIDRQHAIRFEYAGLLPVIECKINGESKSLGLDTGSEINYIFTSDLDRSDLVNAAPVALMGTENKTEFKYQVSMGIRLKDNLACDSEFIVDFIHGDVNPSFDGFLGIPFLSRYNITFHPARQIILFSPRSGSNMSNSLTAQR